MLLTHRFGFQLAICAFALTGVLAPRSPAAASTASCEGLAKLKLEQTEISIAKAIPAGPFTLPGDGGNNPTREVPAFCRVAGAIHPSPDSDITFEVWMPMENWNGRFMNPGNGALAGTILYSRLAKAISEGYATAQTDTGHQSERNSEGLWALGHPEKIKDFGYRAEHESTVKAKAVIKAFYGSGPRYSYWDSCSRGGGEALAEAMRYPTDYDGIIDGANGGHTVRHHANNLWNRLSLYKDPASAIPPAKMKMVTAAVLAQCDGLDGIIDGVIADPRACKFDPALLECDGADGANCLTAAQVKALNNAYDGLKNPKGGDPIVLGFPPGNEASWPTTLGGSEIEFYKGFVFEDAKWDWKTFDPEKDIVFGQKKIGAWVDNTDPKNLEPFFARGGKLLHFHGWNDPGSTPLASVELYEHVQKDLGDTSDHYRLFMFPGMNHCGGGVGPSQWDHMKVIMDWVENGKAPDQIIASKPGLTRPVCAYPKIAKYKGSGSTDDTANFTCATPTTH